jgi:hypothetical protein
MIPVKVLKRRHRIVLSREELITSNVFLSLPLPALKQSVILRVLLRWELMNSQNSTGTRSIRVGVQR